MLQNRNDLVRLEIIGQREYNLLLEQNRPFTEGVTEIIVDTFKDYWLEKKQYNLLEPVEVDLDKRIRESSFLHIAKKIGENVRYEIFSVERSFIRRDRTDRSTVYLGEGTANATVFKEWIYWYEFGSILSEKYIYRRRIDGTGCERLDWLSNEKTLEIAGDFGHYVSEDNVKKMISNSDELIIEVFRKSKNETYKIIITESNGELNVRKSFPQSMLQESEQQ